jgi:hypothetical protein
MNTATVVSIFALLVQEAPQIASLFSSASVTNAQLATDDATEQAAHAALLTAIGVTPAAPNAPTA